MLVYGWKLINITRVMLLMEFCPMVQTFLDGEKRSRNMNIYHRHITVWNTKVGQKLTVSIMKHFCAF
jgi:hypothetical protein